MESCPTDHDSELDLYALNIIAFWDERLNWANIVEIEKKLVSFGLPDSQGRCWLPSFLIIHWIMISKNQPRPLGACPVFVTNRWKQKLTVLPCPWIGYDSASAKRQWKGLLIVIMSRTLHFYRFHGWPRISWYRKPVYYSSWFIVRHLDASFVSQYVNYIPTWAGFHVNHGVRLSEKVVWFKHIVTRRRVARSIWWRCFMRSFI